MAPAVVLQTHTHTQIDAEHMCGVVRCAFHRTSTCAHTRAPRVRSREHFTARCVRERKLRFIDTDNLWHADATRAIATRASTHNGLAPDRIHAGCFLRFPDHLRSDLFLFFFLVRRRCPRSSSQREQCCCCPMRCLHTAPNIRRRPYTIVCGMLLGRWRDRWPMDKVNFCLCGAKRVVAERSTLNTQRSNVRFKPPTRIVVLFGVVAVVAVAVLVCV